MPERPPNVLLVLSDEHDPAVTGCYGDDVVETPHLDALAARGVAFDACYCNSPLCTPSRLSFTAAQYVSRCGAWGNTSWLPGEDYPTIAHALRRAGVEPLLCGKQHYDFTRRYGFTDLIPDLFTNQDRKTGKGHRRDPHEASINHAAWRKRRDDFTVGEHSKAMDHDRRVTAAACDFLRGRRADEGPFFMLAGYLTPHFPLTVPERLAEKYRGRVPMPVLPDGLLGSLPTNYVQHRRGFGTVDVSDDETRLGREYYWALTEWFDGQVGELVAALDASAVGGDTVVIYTSDHGENKGDHGMWWKNCMYDHGARVPLIVSDPRRWEGGQRRGGACSLLDVAQTVLALQGAEPPPDADGDPLLPYLDDAEHAWKDLAVSEYYGHNVSTGIAMIRRGRWKYVYHTRTGPRDEPERELFDMKADPLELNNLAAEAGLSGRLQAMHRLLVEELGEEPDVTEQRCRTAYARGYDR